MPESVEKLGALQLMALETFVESMEADPTIIHNADLAFFKTFLLGIGAKLAPTPAEEGASDPAPADEPEEPDENDPDRLPEDPEPYPATAPSGEVELTDEQMDEQHAVKQAALEAVEEGDLSKAIEKYTEYMMFGNATAMMYAKRAELLLKTKRPKACIADCTAAISINPDSGKAHRIRGKAHRSLGHWEEAHRDLALGQKLDYDDDTVGIQKFVDEKWRKISQKRLQQEKAAGGKRQKTSPQKASPAMSPATAPTAAGPDINLD